MSYYFIAYNKPAYKLKQTPQNTWLFDHFYRFAFRQGLVHNGKSEWASRFVVHMSSSASLLRLSIGDFSWLEIEYSFSSEISCVIWVW